MEYWVIHSRSNATLESIQARIAEHTAYQQDIIKSGKLLASGPYLTHDDNATGEGLTILTVNSRAEAEQIAASDPLVVAQLRSVSVHRWMIRSMADPDSIT
ncbi:YciI family protein [Nocardia sp. NPDC003183]